ncbi:MAG: hypothetical protein AB1657_01585 [Candidatus Micrarchaeota archaeon]
MKSIIALLVFGVLVLGCTLPGPQPETGSGEQGTGGGQAPTAPPAQPPQEPAVNETPPAQPQPLPVIAPPPQTADRQKLIEWYVFNRLTGPEGGVKKASDAAAYPSETVWLVMEYALETGNRTLFDRELSFLEEKQLDPAISLAYEELDSSFSPKLRDGKYHATTANDIRIVRMLQDAKERWGGAEYANAAKRISDSLLAYAVYNNILMKEVSWGGGRIFPSTRMSTAGPEWKAMQRLAAESEEWTSVMERTRSHVLGCQESGLFWPEYDAAGPACDYGAGMDSAQTTGIAATAIALADIQTLEPAVITFGKLTNELNRDDRISASYILQFNGVPGGSEDAATYAAVGRLAAKLERCGSAAEIRDKLLEYFVADTGSPLYGSIAFGGRANAYDNLQALLFLEEYEEKCG